MTTLDQDEGYRPSTNLETLSICERFRWRTTRTKKS